LGEKLTSECPTVPQYRQALAMGNRQLGDLLSNPGRRQEAERAYRLALALQHKVASEYPKVPAFQGELADFHMSLANVLELDRHEEAEQVCEAALDIYHKLVAEFPTVAEYRHSAVLVQIKLGDIYFATDRPEEAVEQHQKQIVLLGQLLDDVAWEAAFRSSLGNC